MTAPLITAYLFHAGDDENPHLLARNGGRSFKSVDLLGMGFTFDDTDKKGVASPLSLMNDLLTQHPHYRSRVLPYIGGEEINDHPRHHNHRYAINLYD